MEAEALIEAVKACKVLPEGTVRAVCRRVRALLFEESTVQPVQAPVRVCGDVHAQFWDLLQLLARGGDIGPNRYIMLGDYVDRGYNSLQTILLLFLYKLLYPDSLVLLRGNHESRTISSVYGFYDEVYAKYGSHNVWYFFMEVFDMLPLGAIVEGQIFCVHGGLSPKRVSIDYIRTIERNTEIPQFGPLCDLMWSDPDEGILDWKRNSRGAGWLFGSQAVHQFLEVNKVKLIVRAHQLVQTGYKECFEGCLSTTWSAPNYCYRMGNLAALMIIDAELHHSYITFEESPANAKNVSYEQMVSYFI